MHDNVLKKKKIYQLFWEKQMQLHYHTSGAAAGIFQKNKVNTMAADALAPCVTRPSAAMALIKEDKGVLNFHYRKNLNNHLLSVEK